MKRWFSILLCAALLLCLLPTAALAADKVDIFPEQVGADFTANPTAAVEALGGTDKAEWDGNSKTLTLKGVNYTATAPGAVKLPADTTIVLADGTTNTITGGNRTVDVSDSEALDSEVYVYGIYATGDLTIQGGDAGTGTLTVTAGDITNSGNSDTNSDGLYVAGNLTVTGGSVTAQGGTAKFKQGASDHHGYAFSHGVSLADGKNLTVSGGSLTGVGGESWDMTDPSDPDADFTYGISVFDNRSNYDTYSSWGNITVSGSGKLTGTCVGTMKNNGLANGIHILCGNLTVSDNAEVIADACTAIDLYIGSIKLSGGSINAHATETGWGYSLDIYMGNLTVTGGTLTASGKGVYTYYSPYNSTANQGVFSVSGGTVTMPSIYGANKLQITGGTVESGYVDVKDAVTIGGGALTVRRAVKTYQDNDGVSHGTAGYAVSCKDLTVTSGTLDAAWDWNGEAPMAVDPDRNGNPVPLVNITSGGSAAFNGGTTLLDTGYAGNLVFNVEPTLGANVTKTGDTWSTLGDNYRQQQFGDTPVVISDVARKSVTVSDITAADKTYDNSISAKLSGGTLNGVDAGDTVTLDMSDVTMQFEDKNVGTGKAVTKSFGQFYLHSKDAYKYILTQPELTGLTASITPCTTVLDTTIAVQTTYKGDGTFDQPHIIGMFGDPADGEVLVDADTGTITYTVSDASITDGTYDEVAAYLKTLDAGTEVTITYTFTGNANYAGATFAGDDGSATDRNTGTITITVIDRYAPVEPVTPTVRTYSLYFDCNGGSAIGSIARVSGATVELSKYQPTKAGYTFAGWYSDAALTKPVSSVTLTKNTTVYAKWTKRTMPFTDVKSGDWYYDAVEYVYDTGLMNGVGGGKFAPTGDVTRGMVATILYRMEGSPRVTSDGARWWSDARVWAMEEGISDGTNMDGKVTREQLAAMLFRYANSVGADTSARGSLSRFSDAANVSGWAADAMQWAVGEGIIAGSNGRLNPKGLATRAEVAAMFMRFCKNIAK